MKKPFQVGERVRVYGHKAFDWNVTDATVIERGTNDDVYLDFIMVKSEQGLRVLAHPKQCRRLLPKKKKKWVWMYQPIRETSTTGAVGYVLFSSIEIMEEYESAIGYRRVKVWLIDGGEK